jgi:hypothetical protein
MTNEFFCKACQCTRVTSSDDGYKHCPQDWLAIFRHQENGARVSLGLICSLFCAVDFLASEDSEREMRPGRPDQVERPTRTHWSKTCGASHKGQTPGVDWVSIASFDANGKRFFVGTFCGLDCAEDFCRRELARYREAA